MFALGALHDGGYDIPANRPLAQHWFLKAAGAGHPQAQLMLGRYLMHGLAGTTDPAAARRWIEAARASGVAEDEFDGLQQDEGHCAPDQPASRERAMEAVW
jgi:TPR repeat protein